VLLVEVSARLNGSPPVASAVISTSIHVPAPMAPDVAAMLPIAGALLYVRPASLQVLSATPCISNPTLEPVSA